MMTGLDSEVVGTEAAAERRDEVVDAVTEHAGRIARELARLQGGDYDAFVAAFNERVRSLAGVLDDVDSDFPVVESVDELVAERERILGAMREATDAMARQLQRYEGGDYGTFAARVAEDGGAGGSGRGSSAAGGSRWELKWEDGRTSYLRVGGEGGIYLLSQYQPPSARDLRAHVPDFPGFVEAFNEEIAAESDSLDAVSL